MKITYVSHATLLIEIDGIKILTDPWLAGPAYCSQWYVFPPPNKGWNNLLNDIDFVLLSHGHEDHTHHQTLKLINKSAKVFYPYTWYSGTLEYFDSLGFENSIEAINEKTYNLKDNIKITFYANNLDNVIVIESNGKTLCHVNDALPSSPVSIINNFIKKLNSRHKKIDYLFSSFGCASYYPNTIKSDWKDDVEVGKLREIYVLDNFCKIVIGLKAQYTIPSASDFALLDDDQIWINEVNFPRENISQYLKDNYTENADSSSIVIMYPGDQIVDDNFNIVSEYHQKFRDYSVNELISDVYKEEIEAKRNEKVISKKDFIRLYEKVKQHIISRKSEIPDNIKNKLIYSLQISDYNGKEFIEIDFSKDNEIVSLKTTPHEFQKLILKIKSKTLNYSLDNEWGGDAIIIGYGCEIIVFDKKSIEEQLDNYAIKILSRYPNTKSYIKRNPIRSMKYLLNDKIKRKMLLDKLLKRNDKNFYVDPLLNDNDIWFNRSKCEICRKCNIPIITDELAIKYYQ